MVRLAGEQERDRHHAEGKIRPAGESRFCCAEVRLVGVCRRCGLQSACVCGRGACLPGAGCQQALQLDGRADSQDRALIDTGGE